MSRAVKVEDKVYEELDRIRGKGETFSQVIEQLLSARLTALELISVLEGSLRFREWQEERLRGLREAKPLQSLSYNTGDDESP